MKPLVLLPVIIDGNLILESLDNVIDLVDGGADAVLGSLERDLVAVHLVPGEAHHHAAELVSDAAQGLAAPRHEVFVVLRVDGHGVLHDVVQLLYLGLHHLLGRVHGLLGADDHDGLLVLVRIDGAGEDDPAFQLPIIRRYRKLGKLQNIDLFEGLINV